MTGSSYSILASLFLDPFDDDDDDDNEKDDDHEYDDDDDENDKVYLAITVVGSS